MGVSHTTSEHIDKQSAPVATSCITLMATKMYQLLKDLLSIFRYKWRACYPAYFFTLLLGDGMPTRGHFKKQNMCSGRYSVFQNALHLFLFLPMISGRYHRTKREKIGPSP
jgi:hypothetical protein